MSYLSVSTWSLHRLMGPLRWTAWDTKSGSHVTNVQDQPQVLTLLELPAIAASRGYQAIEVCHFHFPATDADYLSKLRASFAEANVSFDTLLLDYGNLTSDDEGRLAADRVLYRNWIDIASQCGAKQIRIIAGEAQPTDETAISRSAAALAELAEYAAAHHVRVITENFKELTSTGESSLKVIRQAGETVKMITDFGNFYGEKKYEEIAMTVPYSVSVHAKASYNEQGLPDRSEFTRCLEAVHSVGYDGAYVLIYDGPGDMWEGLERIKRIVQPYCRF